MDVCAVRSDALSREALGGRGADLVVSETGGRDRIGFGLGLGFLPLPLTPMPPGE